MTVKIATCCFCGRRTTLRPTARDGHELACGSCGAPLHHMKPLHPTEARAVASHRPAPIRMGAPKPVKMKKRKKHKPLWRKLAEEVWDEIEDLFD